MSHWTGSVSWNSSTSTTPVALAQARRPRPRRRRPSSVSSQPRQQVVVGHDRPAALAALELVARTARARRRRIACDRCPRARPPARSARPGCSTATRAIRSACGAVEVGGVAAVEAPHVEVVDDLREQVADVLDEGGVGLDVAGDAEAAEHLLAEPVRRGDRRRVEVGERARQALAALLDLVARAGREQRDDLVALGGAAPASARARPCSARHEALAHALAQLAGRHPREGHEQELLERRALGDVARGERGDRERLAGAGARLEHGDAGRQRAADVERPDVGRGAGHRSTTSSQASAPVPQAPRVAAEARRAPSSSQPSPRSSARGGPSSSSSSNAEDAAEHELVLELGVLAAGSSSPTPTPAPAARDGVRRRRAPLRRTRPRSGRRAAAARACPRS